jgi:hypothetical protein
MSHTFTEEYRRSDEYKTLSACVLAVAPTLPQILVEQAIFMHKKDPQLYKKWRNIEKEYEKEQRQAKLAQLKQTLQKSYSPEEREKLDEENKKNFEFIAAHYEDDTDEEETVKNCFPSKDSTHASDEHDPPPSPRSE